MEEKQSNFVAHIPCDECGSSDANSLYDDNHSHCFKCGTTKMDVDSPVQSSPKKKDKALISGEYRDLIKRGLREDTCRKFGYQLGEYKGKPVQIAPYFNSEGIMVAQKVRFPDKEFTVLGDLKQAGLFGSQLWSSGKKLVITEGEIDALTVSQVQGNKWPVVSIPNGGPGAKKSIANALEYLANFEEVIFMFDMDEVGQKAARECAELLPVGKAKIASLPLKDPNELLQAGRGQEIISAIWNAKEYRPDGLVTVDDILEDIEKPIEWGLPWFLDDLTKATYGRRYGEIYGLGAGTGIGKTDLFTQQMAYDIKELKMPIGVIFLEQKPVETGKRVAGKIAGRRFHVPDGGWTQEELRSAVGSLKGMVTFYDSFGQTEWDVVAAKIRYMAAQGIRLFYLDHLTAMADTADEKGSLEQIMKEMAGLANELSIIIHFISHLTTPEGKPHEEGGRVTIRHFKGSRAIGFWAFFLLGMERNQQAEDETERQTTLLRVLKDRYTGQATGLVIPLNYDKESGLLSKSEYSPFKDETTTTEEF